VPLGCLNVAEATPDDIARVREKYNVSLPLVLSLGFTHPDKGTDLLVAAMPMATSSLAGKVQFLIVGAPRRRRGIFRIMGRGDERFQSKVNEAILNLRDVDVSMQGFIPEEDVTPLLFLASAVVLPYRRCTQSAVANRAISAHAVIVASDIPELQDNLGPAAIYFQSENVTHLSGTIVSALEDPPDDIRTVAASFGDDHSIVRTAEALLNLGLFGSTSSS